MVFALSILLPLSCNKMDKAEPQASGIQSIRACYTEIPEPDTKNNISNLRWTVGWNAGDAIAVVNLGTGATAKYMIQSSYVGKNYGIFDHVSGDAGDGELIAIYPFSAASWEDGTLYVTLDDDVVYNASGSYGVDEKPAFATNDIQISPKLSAADLSNELSFYRVVSLISVTANVSLDEFRGETVSDAIISVGGASHIAGKAPVVFSGAGVPSIARNSGSLSKVNVKLGANPKIYSSDYVVRFVPVLPYGTHNGIHFEFITPKYQLGFYRKINWNSPVNSNTYFSLFPGGYTQVESRDDAVADSQWWYTLKAGGMDKAGGFGADGELGSSAGGFVQ